MKKPILYTNEPMVVGEVVPDFPRTDQLAYPPPKEFQGAFDVNAGSPPLGLFKKRSRRTSLFPPERDLLCFAGLCGCGGGMKGMQVSQDISLYDDAKKRDEEFFPAALIKSIVDGASPVRVYRTHRGLTQRALAARMGISRSYLAEIESGKKRRSVTVLRRAAAVLTVDLDMLVTDWEFHENKPS